MHFRFALTLTLALVLTNSAAGLTRIVPIAGHTEGAFGTFWRTDLLLSNSAGQSQVVTLSFYPTGFAPVTRNIVIGPLDTILVADAVDPGTFAQPPRSWIGQLTLESTQGLHASAHTWTTSPTLEGTYGGVNESYDLAIIPSHGTLTGLLVSGRFRSNVAFANGSIGPTAIDFTVRDAAGQLVREWRLQLGAHETRQLSVAQDLGLSEGVYSLEWTAATPAIAIASIIDNLSGDPGNAPSIANARSALCFPIVGKVDGALGTAWRTSFSMTTESAAVATVTLVYHGTDGLNAQRVVAIPAKGTLVIDDLLDFLGVASGIGYFSVASDVPIVASARIFNTLPGGATYGSLLLPQEPAAESDVVRIRGVRRTADFRANVVLTNRTTEPTAGWLRFFDRRGDVVEKHWFVLKAHDTAQIALNGSVVDVEAGEVEVRTADGVPLLAIVSNIDNASGDTLVRETEQEIERQLEP